MVKTDDDAKTPTSMQEVNLALQECGFGWFHIRVLITSFLGFVAGITVSNTTPYILPSAECDLQMDLVRKGLLNAMPFLGMTLISIVAGFLTDTFGRKLFLLIGYGGLFFFTMVAGSSQNYEIFITAKFFEGILFATSFSSCLTLTSEFCHNGIRDRMMLFQSSFAACAQIIIALIAWGVLTQDWRDSFFGGRIVLNTWNFYLFIMSLWSLGAFILYALLPESPKFYVTQKKYDEAREILIKIYRVNTGKPAETFPYANLWIDKEKRTIDEEPEAKVETNFARQLSTGFDNVKPMFMKPLMGNLMLVSGLNFFIMVLYNVIRLWFPQLSTIVEHYSTEDGVQDLCTMLDTYTSDQKLMAKNSTSADVCIPTESGTETYINSVILGCVCLIPFWLSGILVNKVGKKNLYLVAGLYSVGATLGLRWAKSKVAIVALFASDASIAQIMMSLNQALIIELFPTTIRSLALSVIMTSGRIGTLVGNVTFPVLLNMGCQIPFFTLAGLMTFVTIVAVFLPTKK